VKEMKKANKVHIKSMLGEGSLNVATKNALRKEKI